MNGFAGTRVIVVDDEEKDALPILKELSRRGIPATYFDGNQRRLPPKKRRLCGVRLAILDMDLVGGVPDKSKMSTLMNVVKGILSPQNGPYGVIAWTGHSYLRQEFENAVFVEADIPKPIFTITLAKGDCKNKKGDLDLNVISKKIDDALAQFSPLLLLQAWEEKCFLAATQVTNELATLASSDAPSLDEWRNLWRTQFLQLMHTIAAAEAGKQLDSNSCLNALYGSLNPLHSDRMESNIPGLCTSLSDHSAEIMASTPSGDSHAKARLNTMLHLATDSVNRFYAGNIYMGLGRQRWIPSVDELLDDLVTGANDKKRAEAKAALTPVSTPVVIEVNATCDHSQNNVRIARFIAGLLIPASENKKIKKNAGFIHELGPVFLELPILGAGDYYFYFSARHLLTTKPDMVIKAKAFARLRGQAFADLQFWFAYQAARPGKLMIKD